MNDDSELLRRYARDADEDAFTELVRRHLNLVYSAALRQVNGDAHLAADVTQLVFTDLARKAGQAADHRVLAGWLFTSTRFAAAKLVRGERRRHLREQNAQLMQDLNHDDSNAQLDWREVRPVIDGALAELKEEDREAILLRFFEGCDYARVGAKLNVPDNTARMRVERALDRLRALLERKGVTSTSAALATALGHQAVGAAPVGLAATVVGAALGSGAGMIGAAGTAGAVGAAGFMSMTKLQVGISAAIAVAGTTGYVVQAEANARLRSEVAELRQHHERLPNLERENIRLKRAIAEAGELKGDDAEFARLQEEAVVLRTRLLQLAKADAARSAAQREASAEVFDITKLDQTPRAKFQARPQYPFEMRRAGIPGEVVVDFIVDSAGNVQNAYALRSSQREFEAAAVQAVSKWKFVPGRKDGRDVNTHLQVPMVFTLSEGTSSGNTRVVETPKPIRHTEPGETFQVDAQRQDPSSNRESAAAGSGNR